MNEKQLIFKDLYVGDRFKLSNGSVWTKLSPTTGRKHDENEISLKERGYGYIGCAVCSFQETDSVSFMPVEL